MATSRPRRGSRARYTSPMPPLPSGASSSYGPRRVPTEKATSQPDEEVPRRGAIICSTTQAIVLDQRSKRRGQDVCVLSIERHRRPDLEDVVMRTVGPDENAFVAQTVDDLLRFGRRRFERVAIAHQLDA